MRYGILGVAAAMLLGACDALVDRIDAVQASGQPFSHERLKRFGEEGEVVRSIAPDLRTLPDARLILDEGQKAVPGLEKLLGDPARRRLAALFLAEIGGKDAASALLKAWRGSRGEAREMRVYRVVGSGRFALGYVYEDVDHAFYAEVLMALGRAGRPLSDEIASDTSAAMAESERLEAAGVEISFREERDEDGRRLELRWLATPVQTACEGLRLLAMAGAPEAPALFAKALASPIRALRWTAVNHVLYLGPDASDLLPALGGLLDDPEVRAEALEPVAFLLDNGTLPDPNLSDDQRAVLVSGYKARIERIGSRSR